MAVRRVCGLGLCAGSSAVVALWWAVAPINGIDCLMLVPTDGMQPPGLGGRLKSLPAVPAMPAVQAAVHDLDQRTLQCLQAD